MATTKPTKFARVALLIVLLFVGFGLWHSFERSNGKKSPGVRLRGEASPEWDIGDLGQVRMLVENTERYRIDTEEGTADWEKLIPQNGGIVYLPNAETGELEQYTISLFHELRCLDVIRRELVRPTRFESPTPNEPLVKHCLNYVRQMVLCRSDLYLESVRDPIGPAADITHVRGARTGARSTQRLKTKPNLDYLLGQVHEKAMLF
ncbi:hypothetical protein SCHPADRAFT_942344 [Schizopora paradoxa]|uniref:Uncharacterized protein n=1 Tax=Schizopora paradoxa TaxID=27342 RepID=A0A0H2RGT7_9AGAM|nr:hypothetical protein SCHPADRAFT_942344 [Schizopora paradoxa]